tara:strand:+ start:135 stop:476 length:342 start_codon:yes stop_codon:yes gene_type:complete
MSIIGIVLGTIAIGLFIWLKNDQKMSNALHEGDLIAAKHAYEALMGDFNNYQITSERKILELDKELKVLKNQTHQWNKVANSRMDKMNKSLPSIIGQVVGQIEFSQDTLNRKI